MIRAKEIDPARRQPRTLRPHAREGGSAPSGREDVRRCWRPAASRRRVTSAASTPHACTPPRPGRLNRHRRRLGLRPAAPRRPRPGPADLCFDHIGEITSVGGRRPRDERVDRADGIIVGMALGTDQHHGRRGAPRQRTAVTRYDHRRRTHRRGADRLLAHGAEIDPPTDRLRRASTRRTRRMGRCTVVPQSRPPISHTPPSSR